jgi:hypothetical protein
VRSLNRNDLLRDLTPLAEPQHIRGRDAPMTVWAAGKMESGAAKAH